jgi:hypothetical protein
VINLNVICALVLYGVGGELDGVDVVTIDKHAPTQKTVKVLKHLAQQVGLSHAISNSAVLCTSARERFDASITRRLSYPQEILRSSRWTDGNLNNQPSQHKCRRRAQLWMIGEEGPTLKCPTGSARCT